MPRPLLRLVPLLLSVAVPLSTVPGCALRPLSVARHAPAAGLAPVGDCWWPAGSSLGGGNPVGLLVIPIYAVGAVVVVGAALIDLFLALPNAYLDKRQFPLLRALLW